MNNLQKFIKGNPNNWKQLLEDKHIRIKEDEHFYIFNYGIGADFFDIVVRNCRGIILDKDDFSVACYPFDKFGNYGEPYVDKIDWQTARVQEKLDGSIIKCFWNKYTNEWQWSTNGVIDARNCDSNSIKSKTFYDIIQKADNLKDINFDNLDKTKTYIFELTGPENQIVVKYDKIHLYHIGTRSNITSEEFNDDIRIEKPKEYPIHNFEDCLKAVEELNKTDVVEHEGFVVVDVNWNRIKVKNAEYLMMHHLANDGQLVTNKSKILELLQSDDFNEEEILKQYPYYKEVFDYYRSEIERVYQAIDNNVLYARMIYTTSNNDRKYVAEKLKGNRYASIMFRALGNNKTTDELISEIVKSKYEDLIIDFSLRGEQYL